MKKINLSKLSQQKGSQYPTPFDQQCRERLRTALGDAAGLTDFGVNLLQLPPNTWSSQRHWHSTEDEFVWILQGEVTLVTEEGEELLQSGDCVGFKAGVPDGHHLQNRSDTLAVVLEIGSRRPLEDIAEYPDIDLRWGPEGKTHKNGTPY